MRGGRFKSPDGRHTPRFTCTFWCCCHSTWTQTVTWRIQKKTELTCTLTLLHTSADTAFFTRVLLQNFIHSAAVLIGHQAPGWHVKRWFIPLSMALELPVSLYAYIKAPGSASLWMVRQQSWTPPSALWLRPATDTNQLCKTSGVHQEIYETLGLRARTISPFCSLTLLSESKKDN